MKKTVVCLADGFEEIEAVTIIDILRRAEVDVTTASVSGSALVKGAHHVEVRADKLFEDVDFRDIDMIILPGGMPGAQNLNNHKGVQDRILDFSAAGKMIGAICAAPMVLGNLGLLENRNVTCYPGFGNYLKKARLKNDAVVEDRNLVTANGPAAAVEFALKLVEKLKGRDMADMTARKMLVPGK